jgi:hypothetical protein
MRMSIQSGKDQSGVAGSKQAQIAAHVELAIEATCLGRWQLLACMQQPEQQHVALQHTNLVL